MRPGPDALALVEQPLAEERANDLQNRVSVVPIKGVLLCDLLQNRCPQGFSPRQPVLDQLLSNRIDGFGKVHGQLPYA